MSAPVTCAVLGTDRRAGNLVASVPGVRETLHVDSLGEALALATQPWLVVVQAGAILAEDAFARLRPALYGDERRIVYTDEHTRVAGSQDPVDVLKPGWSPRLFREGNYLGDLCLVRVDAARAAGGFGADGMYGLLRRMVSAGAVPHHAPIVAVTNPRAAVWPPTATDTAWQPHHPHGARLPVTIVVPTRDRVDLLRACINSIEAVTDYPDYEIIVVDNGSTEAAARAYLAQIPHRVIPHPGPFNFSDLVNAGVAASTRPLLVLLNNDTEMTQPHWLARLADELEDERVGAVGCRLVGVAGDTQHEGIGLSMAGLPAMNLDLDHYLRLDEATRDVVAVTAACVLIPRDAFEAVGGFDRDLAVGFGDVDFCLRLRAAGYNVVYTPEVAVRHVGQASRGVNAHPQDDLLFGARWPAHRARALDVFTPERVEGYAPLWVREDEAC